jgi:Carboxypeptidase regulatory-like domain
VTGDYDGDGITDIAVFNPSTATFDAWLSKSQSLLAFQFGNAEDTPLSGDYDGDGTSDIAVFHPSTATFDVWLSKSQSLLAFQFGSPGDMPVSAEGTLAQITGQVSAGGAALPGVTVSLSGSTSLSTTTDSNGNYLFSIPAGGSYTVTPSLSGTTFSPESYAVDNLLSNQIADFAQTTASSSTEDWNGFLVSAGSTATPSGTGCGDISGSWTETDAYGSSTWNLMESSNGTVSGRVTYSNGPSCGTVTYSSVTGQQTNGVFYLTASSPNESYDACGYSITPTENQQVSLSNSSGSCSSGSATWSSNFGAGQSSWTGQVPTSLKVVPSGVTTFTNAQLVANGFSSNCAGIIIGITYQVLDQKGNAYNVAGLVPQEMMSNVISDGKVYIPIPLLDPWVNFFFVDIYPNHPEKNTSATGTFSDSPFGACAGTTSTMLHTASDTQQIRLVNPKNSGNWIVRTNNWKYSSPGPGHGSVTNNVDVTATR